MLKPEAAWTDSQKKEMMRFNQVQPLIGMNGKEYYSERDLAKANALYENKQIIKDERPKTLSPNNSSSESGKALSQTLASDFEAYKGGLQQRRDERYQSIIDKLPSIEGPTNRKK